MVKARSSHKQWECGLLAVQGWQYHVEGSPPGEAGRVMMLAPALVLRW